MHDYAFSRRTVLAGLAGTCICSPSFADDPKTSPVAQGVLANNKLAQAFEDTRHDFPDVGITGPNGTRPISEVVAGKIVLMPLWAEWCAPCLTELGDFARLQEVYGNDKFAIIPVMTGTRHRFTPDTLSQLLRTLNAGIFAPLMEENYGQKLLIGMAQRVQGPTIPCNVLIGSSGRVVAREIGLQGNADAADTNKERLNQAIAGNSQSLWGTPAGDEFAACMSNGYMKI